MEIPRYSRRVLLAGLMLVALVLRLVALVQSARLGADEAVEGLMARHILTAGELPAFYWGQAFFGAAEAYLVAGLFFVFGFQPWLVFVPAVLASVVLVPLVWALAECLGPWPAGVFAALPVALPPPVLSRMLGNAGGGFSLGFALEYAALLCFLRGRVAACSLLAGLAVWVWQPALIGLTPILLLVLLTRRPRAWQLALGGIGLAPMLAYNVAAGWPTPAWLVAKFHAQGTPPVGPLLLTVVGGGDETIGGVNPAQAALVSLASPAQAVAVGWLASRGGAGEWRARAVATALLILVATLNTISAHGSAHHLVPAALAGYALSGASSALVAARWRGGGLVLGLGLSLLVFGVGNLSAYADIPQVMAAEQLSGIEDTRAAIAALDARGLSRGYADYWTAYPIIYLSDERIVVAPSLPLDWGAGVDRYPSYTRQVEAVADPARVFLLLDRRCPVDGYLGVLDRAHASYRADDVGRWRLVWDIHAEPSTLSSVVGGPPTC